MRRSIRGEVRGVVTRDAVRDGADYFTATPSLGAVLPLVLTDQELAALAADARFAPLLSCAEG